MTLEEVFWDLYYEVHGVRPRGLDTSAWTTAELEHAIYLLEQSLAS